MESLSILQNCGELNVAGILLVEYIPTSEVLDISGLYLLQNGNYAGTMVLASGTSWLQLPIYTLNAERQLYTETANQDAHGTTYSAELQGFVNGNTPAMEKLLDKMGKHWRTYLLRLTDANGQVWLVGSLEYPFRFKSNYSSREAAHSITFYAKQPHKKRGWNI
jgi:hypothetical protein